jgi:hypothetical protein
MTLGNNGSTHGFDSYSQDARAQLGPSDAVGLLGAHRSAVQQFLGDGSQQTANLVGIGIGVETTGGQPTGEKALVALVDRKLTPAELSEDDMLPKTHDGVRLDVVEVGQIFSQVLIDPVVPATAPMVDGMASTLVEPPSIRVAGSIPSTLRRKMRPAQGGFSVGHYKITAGTIATAVYRILPGGSVSPPAPGLGIPGNYFILSNNHVLANSNNAQIGDPILQPGPFDGSGTGLPGDHTDTPAPAPFPNLFGKLSQFVNIQFEPPIPRALHRNVVDCAIAQVDLEDMEREIFWVGDIQGWRLRAPRPGYPAAISVGTPVQKTGRTTGWTTGRITALFATVDVNYGGGRVARFHDQIITTNMSAPGDSGSLLLTMDNVAVGLLFAGSNTITIYNQFENVRALLGVEAAQRIM